MIIIIIIILNNVCEFKIKNKNNNQIRISQ